MNYYDILGIKSNASQDAIKKAYRKLSMEKHPDKNPSAINEYKKINEAYEILKDQDSRNMYDMNMNYTNKEQFNPDDQLNMFFSELLSAAIDKGSKKKSPLSAMFGMSMPTMDESIHLDNNIPIFMSNGAGFPLEKEKMPEDISIEQTLSYNQAYNGCYIPIIVKRNIIKGSHKNTEKETIYINIKKGVDNNEIILIENKGNIINDLQSNIKVKILLNKSPDFDREGINLILYKKITFKESLAGFSFDIDHLNGNKIKFSSSKGNVVQNGDTKHIKKLGFCRDNLFGDLILSFIVIPPKELTTEQLNLIEDIF
uniref:Chaperone Protein Dnaj n=1 Tax=Florenciella sp. virus SA2 TaxID=3240092 RepID=A0AB39JCY4_9VIRU